MSPRIEAAGVVTLLVVAKAPVPGRAKTRLTPPLSEQQAAALAAAALLDTLDAVAAVGSGPAVLALTGDLGEAVAEDAVRSSLDRFRVVAQRGEGFAERLVHAHRDAAGEHGAVLQVGMDTPQLDPAVLREAARRLVDPGGPDAVLGPAADGGWWCLGLRRAGDADVLSGVAMSTARTGPDTLAALEGAGLVVEMLPELVDVDEVADVAAAAGAAPGSRFAELAAALLPDELARPHADPQHDHHQHDHHQHDDPVGPA